MNWSLLWIVLLSVAAGAYAIQQEGDNVTEVESNRNGKIFSLFSIVQFKNTGCKSQSAMSTGQSAVRNGTCFTASECSNKGGTASGNCAAGFGVCCLFLVSTTGSTINQNCTYLRNPSFPSVYSATSSLSYTVTKCSTDVCYLRLDFETFTTIAPTISTEASGYSCPDTFKVTSSTSQSIPTICGLNTGQHIYVDIGNQATDSVALAFTFSTSTSTTRTWEIKISQISCNNPGRPPNGCLQYWSTIVGRITTFNFLSTVSAVSSNLPTQSYSACIRRAAGYCCIEYQVCAGITYAFTLDSGVATVGYVDTYCTADYVAIPASSSGKCSGSSTNLNNKYCGNYLGLAAAAATISNQFICDCTTPFEIFVYADAKSDISITNAFYSRGNCLDFMQVPCSQV